VNLRRNGSSGSLSIGEVCCTSNRLSSDLVRVGALDSTIVNNVSLIEWIEVVPFQPFGAQSNVSSYLQWATPISNITVSNLASSLAHAHAAVCRSGTRLSGWNLHTLKKILTDLWRCSTCKRFPNLFFLLRLTANRYRGTAGIFGPYQDVSFGSGVSLSQAEPHLSFQVERLFSGIDGSRLVDSSEYCHFLVYLTRISCRLTFLAGQWVIPCNTNLTMTITFRQVGNPHLRSCL
jgi:hypothetical protein